MESRIASRLAIQSFCFRGLKDHEAVIQALHGCGVQCVELSAGHLNPAMGDARQVLERYRRAGIQIPTFGVHRIDADEAKARQLFDMAKLAGVPVFGVTFAPGGIPVAEKLCPEYGIRVAIHNHGRKDPLGALAVLSDIISTTSDWIGLCLDTAWMLDSGEDPVAVADRFYPRLYSLHFKDFIFDRAGKPQDVIVGEGNLDLNKLAAMLIQRQYAGTLTCEYEGDVNDPVPATRRCVEAIDRVFAKAEAAARD